ncbi:hypothetical protein H0H92_010095 [Tricholoma furcatifolium]|nr:hypothetical protein H0H92_010095 [Tricholoma furcatifolium]
MYNWPIKLPMRIQFFIFVLVRNIIVNLAITPFLGVLVRYRAHYSPKAVQLGADDAVPARTGPTISSYFSTFKRVYKLEGWAGLYKGMTWPGLSLAA